MRAFRALFSLLATFVVVVAASSEAQAFERQWQAGLSAGYTHFVNYAAVNAASFPGFGTSLSLSYGITDAINIIGHVDFSAHPGKAPVLIYGGGAGVAYVIDIVRWVPWIGATVGGYAVSNVGSCAPTADAPCTTGRFALSPIAGLDYQFTRKFSLGAVGRYDLLLFGKAGDPSSIDHAISIFARAQYIWGY